MLLIILLTVSAVSCLPVREPLCHQVNEFACKNGVCISAEWICDNVPDCLNEEDETECHYLHDCPKDSFMCRTGECMPKEVKCDGHRNCSDGSDEQGCIKIHTNIPAPLKVSLSSSPSLCHSDNEFACNNGTCITAEWLCDNVHDCLDGEDEAKCDYLHDCPKDSFMCRSGECIPKEVKCDGHLNCPDGSDEQGCMKIRTNIPAPLKVSLSSSSPSLCHSDNEFACKNGVCISAEWLCDNVPDCLNGEDEAKCDYLHDCPKDSFMCRTGECMPKEVKCDGHLNCPDGSDEQGCMIKINTTVPTTVDPYFSSTVDPSFSMLDNDSSAVWIYIILMVLALILIGLIGFGLKYWFFTPRPAADETKVQFLVVEDDGRCTAY